MGYFLYGDVYVMYYTIYVLYDNEIHYENISVQYAAIFHDWNMVIFRRT